MSHESRFKCRIQNANLVVLKSAVSRIAAMTGGTATDKIQLWYQTRAVDAGLQTRENRLGVGFRIINGQLEAVHDSMMDTAPQIIQVVEREYMRILLLAQVQAQGFSIEIDQHDPLKGWFALASRGKQRLAVIISLDGRLYCDWQGWQGKACFAEAQKLVQALAQQGLETSAEFLNVKPEGKDGGELDINKMFIPCG